MYKLFIFNISCFAQAGIRPSRGREGLDSPHQPGVEVAVLPSAFGVLEHESLVAECGAGQ